MVEKTVLMVGRHPLTADARERFVSSRYTVCDLSEASDEAEIPATDEIFVATGLAGTDAFEEDSRNIGFLKTICGRIGRSVRIHLLLHSPDTLLLFQQQNLCEDFGKDVEIFPFTVESIWGQHLFSGLTDERLRFPHMDREPLGKDSDKTVHLVIFGMNSMAESIARHAALTCHYPNFIRNHSLKTRITIVDENIESRRDMFISKYSPLFENSFYRFVDLGKEEGTAVTYLHVPAWAGRQEDYIDIEWEFVKGSISRPVLRRKLSLWATSGQQVLTLVLCHENGGTNISDALQLPGEIASEDIPVFTRIEDRSKSIYLTGRDHLIPFGMKDCCHDIRLPLISAAKLVNYIYDCCYNDNYTGIENSGQVLYPIDIDKEKVNALWKGLGNTDRWSSIYNAMTIGPKMRSLGHTEDEWDSFYSISAKEIYDIAEVEHNRWNVEKLLMGFRPADLKQTEDIEKDINLKQEYKNKRIHYDIRAYKDLRPDGTGKNVNTYDICLSAAIPLIAEALGKEVSNG